MPSSRTFHGHAAHLDGRRVAIVAGLRTPFCRRGTAFRRLSALDLARAACRELIERLDLDPALIDQVVYGQVVPSLKWTSIAREIVLGIGLPPATEAFSVSRACATGYQAVVSAAQAIRDRAIDAALAGGADSASDVPIGVSDRLQRALLDASLARALGARLGAFRGLRLRDLLPVPPALAEPSTGETMGGAGERMARANGISRAAQDALAHRSHVLAAQAWQDGRLAEEVVPVHVPPRYAETVERDNTVRADSDLAAYAKLRPAFDRRHGTVTAGNSSPLTDGASVALVMAEEKARALGLPVLGLLRSYAFVGVDPADQLLIGPAYAVPRALDAAGMTMRDMDLVDIHEAFASVVLSIQQRLDSAEFARRELGRDAAVGAVPEEKLNVCGGSIAIGHPFAATGVRQMVQTLRELKRRGGGAALCTACAAGGLGAAVVLEAPRG